jgi:hypothetical protein
MRMSISPDISELSPGDEVELTVKMANDGSEEIIPILEVAGLSADLWRLANPIPVIPAGEIGQTSILIRVPADTPPGDRRISVTVRSPLGNAAASAPAALRVGAGDVIAVEASPQAVTGRKGAGLSAIVHNRGSEDLTLRIAGRSEGAGVEVKPAEFRLPAGQSTRVKARFTRAKRSWFRERKHGVVFDVRGHTVPATTTAMFVQRPVVPPVLLRSLAVLVALAVWASAVFVIFTSMAATDEAATDTGEVVDTGPLPPPPPVVLPDPDADPAALDGQVAPPVVIQGAVEGPRNPADTVVVIERVSFGDQGTTNGTGKIAASATPVALASGSVLDKVRTTTDDRGRFRVASGLRANAFYRVSALRAGFEVRSVVVSTSTSTEIDLALTLIPANGQMSGTVVDSNGVALGGVTVEATQGLITYRTVTSSSGEDTGRWTIDALATPATYLITVRQLGYASQTLTVDLDGGQALGGVDAVLTANMGTIRGQITYRDAGVGAITVNLDGDGGKRETTTLTDGPLAGSFTIPSLPYGTYLLTFSGEGWMTQSREVTVDTGDVPVSVRDLVPSTGIIQGIVAQQTVAGGCKYPDTTGTVSETLAPSPCGGVGVTVVNDDGIWRTTTATSDGSFLFSNIPAGEYTVKFERFGYLPEYYTVKLNPGDVVNVPGDATYDAALASALGGGDRGFGPLSTTQVQMRVRPAAPLNEGIIEGFIRDVTAQEIAFDDPTSGAFGNNWEGRPCNAVGAAVNIVVVGATTECELTPGGGYRLTNVDSGVQRIRFNIAGFDEGVIVVRVSPTDISSGGVVNLLPRASVTLNLTSGGENPVGNAIVFVGPLAVDGSTIDDSAAGVNKCTIFRPRVNPEGILPEIWRQVDVSDLDKDALKAFEEDNFLRYGLCSRSDLSGDAVFASALGPGSVDIIVPVNATDPTTSAQLARTVPLDHRQLVRSLAVTAGENVRLDLRLRRYPVLVGSIQRPRSSGIGFERVDVSTSAFPGFTVNDENQVTLTAADVTLCEVDLGNGNCRPFLDPKVQPRLSMGEDSGLNLGQFRIDRIPPNEGVTARTYRLIIRNPLGQFSRDPDRENAIENLTFGDERAISAIMAPTPLNFGFRLLDGSTQLTGGFVKVLGTLEYRSLEAAPFQEILRAVCPSDDCLDGTVSDDDGRRFTISPLARNGVEGNPTFAGAQTGSYFSLGNQSTIEFLQVFRPGDLEIEARVPGYAPVTLVQPARGSDGSAAPEIIPIEMEALPRRVEATISASPVTVSGQPGGFDHSVLSISLVPAGGGVPIVAQPNTAGAVLFPAVPVGAYSMRISGPGIHTRDIDQVTVSAGVGPFPVQDAGTTTLAVDRQLTLNVAVRNPLSGSTVPVPGAEVIISRTDGVPLEDGSASRTLLTCTAAAGSGGAPGCVAAGSAPFTGLRVGEYAVTVSALGFVGTQTVTTSVTSDTQTITFDFDRYGSVSGTVRVLPGPNRTPINPTSPITVTLLREAVGGLDEVATFTSTDTGGPFTVTEGRFAITNLAQVEEGEYQLRVATDGFTTVTTSVFSVSHNTSLTVSNSVLTTNTGPVPVILLEAAPATFGGIITDGTAEGAPLAGVRVSVLVDGEVLPEYTVFSTSAGAYSVKVPAGLPVTIRFESLDNGQALRPIFERVVNLEGGQSQPGNVSLPLEFGSITGFVVLRDREGAVTQSATIPADIAIRRLTADGLADVTRDTVAPAGTFSFSEIRTGNYSVTVSAANYLTNTANVFVAFNGGGTVNVVLTAAPRDATIPLSSNFAGSSIAGVTVSAVSTISGATVVVSQSAMVVEDGAAPGGFSATFTDLQPGEWTFTTEGGPDLAIPHLNITNGAFTLAPGDAPPAVLNTQMSRYAQITGMVALDRYDDSITLPDFDWTVSNAALTATRVGGTGSEAKVVTSTTDATFTVWVPTSETWTLQASRDDFVTTSSAVTSDLAASVGAGTLTLLPAPRNVTVTVTTAALSGAVQGLAGLTLVATPPVGTALEPVTTSTPAADGVYTFGGLAPANWSITTQGAPDLAVPHVDAVAELAVPLGTDPFTVDDPIIAYMGLSGAVEGRITVGDATSPLEGVTVTATQSGQTVSTLSILSAEDPARALWSLGVVGDEAIEISWTKSGYDTEVTTAATPTSPVNIVLTAAARNVTVSVTGAPDGLQLEATRTGFTSVSADLAGGSATFAGLAPGDWAISSVNAASLGVVSLTGATVSVEVATSAALDLEIADPIYVLVPVTISVTGVDVVGANPVSLSAATVTVSAGTETLVVTTDAEGAAVIYLDGDGAVAIDVSALGYAPDTTTSAITSPSGTVALELVALPRNVAVTVKSSTDSSGVSGVTVSATPTSGGAAITAISDLSGVATLAALTPGEWTFSVSDSDGSGHLAVGPVDNPAAEGAPRTVTLTAGDPAVAVPFTLVLQALDATVAGTVFLVSGDDAVSPVPDSVTVTASSGSLSRTTTTTDGAYSLAITSDREWIISITGYVGSTTTSVKPAAGATANGDVTVSASVRNIGGTISGVDGAATVTITAMANGFAPITQTRTGNGAYTFSGLNAMVTWTITFSVESTDGPITVIRYVAPGVADVTSLDQDLATASVGEIVIILNDTGVDIREGVLMVTVILSDPNPFPQLRTPITKTVTLAVDEADATVSFGPLGTVPGADPFSVEVTADDYAAVVPLSVTAGDEVAVTLTPAARTVVLTLTKDFDATVSTAPKLYDGDSVTLSGTVDPEAGNVFTITGVTPGDWVVQVPGYPDVLISVPIGDTAIEVSFDVQLASVAAAIQFVQDGEVITEGFVGANDPDLAEIQIRLVDADGDLVNSTAEFEVELTTQPVPPVSLVIDPLTGTLVAGQTTVTLRAPDVNGGSGVITVTVGSIITTIVIRID